MKNDPLSDVSTEILTKRDLIEFLRPFSDDIRLSSEFLNDLRIVYVPSWENKRFKDKSMLVIGDKLDNF